MCNFWASYEDVHLKKNNNFFNPSNLCFFNLNFLRTLKELIFAGTKFREFRGFWGHPQNLIPAKRKKLTIREI